MRILTAIRIAIIALARNRLRSGLTVLGVMVGIAAVICTVAIGEGSAAVIHQQLLNLGDNFIWIENGSRNVGGVRTGNGGVARLTADDMYALLDEVPELARCSPQVDQRGQLIRGSLNWNTQFRGVSPDYLEIRKWTIASGSSFSENDVLERARVTVIGRTIADQLFGDEDPIGQTIRIGSVSFEVLGVLNARGQSPSGQDQDDTLFIPYSAVQHYFKKTPYIDDMMCSATSTAAIPVAQAEIVDILRRRHHIEEEQSDDFNIRKPEDAIRLQEDTALTMGYMLSAVASVSLVIGGVGIMNIMLVSVAERTREIGLRLALGAKERDVRRQFLAEALVLGLVGGAFGVVLGIVAAQVFADKVGWPMLISSNTILIAVGFSSLVGVVFGFYPARHAASLDPIEALRAE